MRELKFRAWDKNGKRFLNGFYLYTGSCVGNAEIGVWNNAETDIVFDDYPQLILSQYTGLKDKNGKEIYEGDMLSVDGRNSGLPVVVIYEDGAFMGAYTDSTFKYLLNSGELHLQKTEVIGNVYENPELLTPDN